jgi:hypothetical protein
MVGNDILPASQVELVAFVAERLTARSLPEIFALDIVAGIAVRIVVMNRLLDRMPSDLRGISPSITDSLLSRMRIILRFATDQASRTQRRFMCGGVSLPLNFS